MVKKLVTQSVQENLIFRHLNVIENKIHTDIK